MKTVIYTNPTNTDHNTGAGHPESPDRLMVLYELFQEEPFNAWLQERGQSGTNEQLSFAHTSDYIYDLLEKTPEGGLHFIDNDTVLSPSSYDCALASVGTACTAIDDIADNNSAAFCAIRPPGHHANADTAMGFCLFNNIFIAARYAQETYGFKNIAIVDFDVHHGNGTQDLTKAHNAQNPDKPIFYASSHAAPLWPMTGTIEDNDDLTCNVPLALDSDSSAFKYAYRDEILPALEAFKPEILLISAGFDAHKDDPLATLSLTESDFHIVTTRLKLIADKYCDGRILSILEGGYNLEALKNSVRAHLLALNGE